jgi:ankyrin repeat protein
MNVFGNILLNIIKCYPNYKLVNFIEFIQDLDAVSGPRAEGRTALHIAAEHGHAANVAVLVDAGANLLVRDHLGLTPLDLADKAEHTECMSVLRMAADKQVATTPLRNFISEIEHGVRIF